MYTKVRNIDYQFSYEVAVILKTALHKLIYKIFATLPGRRLGILVVKQPDFTFFSALKNVVSQVRSRILLLSA